MRCLPLLFLFLLSGCGSYFQPDRNISDALTAQQITGTWKITPESLTLLRRDGFQTAPEHAYTIQLHADGTCDFRSVEFQTRAGIYVEQKGTWTLAKDVRETGGVKKNELQMEFRSASRTTGDRLDFTRVDGTLRLFRYHGDPDQFEFIEYTRTQ